MATHSDDIALRSTGIASAPTTVDPKTTMAICQRPVAESLDESRLNYELAHATEVFADNLALTCDKAGLQEQYWLACDELKKGIGI